MNAKAIQHFKKADPILYKIAVEIELSDLALPKDPFVDLIDSIISQQLSGKAAATIFERFKNLFPKRNITPYGVLKLSDDQIRKTGISYGKIGYIKGISQSAIDGALDFKKIEKMQDEEVIYELTKQKGIGVWTAEMFLMFTLLREDVFSVGDLGLRNAVIKHYKLSKPTKEKFLKISAKWSPHRSYASRLLWKSLEK